VVRALLSKKNKEGFVMTRYKSIFIRVLPVLLLLAIAVPSQAATFTFTSTLTGPNEAPPNASPGTGFATIVFDNVLNTMSINAVFTGLLGTTTMSHIHCCTAVPFTGTAGVATQTPSFALFPLGVTSGSFSNTFDLTAASSYNPAFVAANGGSVPAAEAALIAGAIAGQDYLNIHTTVVPGGEIRGFLVAAPVATPEASTVALLGICIVGILGFAWRKRLTA
jgi:hypothetical protein